MADLNRNASIIALRKDGIGPREIARRMRVSPGVVAGVLDRAGLTDSNNNRVPDAYMERVLKDLKSGTTYRAAADRWGVAQSTINRHRRAAERMS